MYLQHFGLTRYPFPKSLAPEELFLSGAAHELHARLEHWLELRSIALITGEVGSGKTTLCRRFAASLHPGLHRLFYVCHCTGNPTDLYKLIAWELRLAVERNRAALFRSIQAEVTRLITETRVIPVLVIDEAQNLRSLCLPG
jgi:type II secretory pathway predicted ATPase ExeA